MSTNQATTPCLQGPMRPNPVYVSPTIAEMMRPTIAEMKRIAAEAPLSEKTLLVQDEYPQVAHPQRMLWVEGLTEERRRCWV